MTYKNDNSTQLRMSIRMTSEEKTLIERTMKKYNITGVALMLQGIENIKKKRGYRMTLDEINFMKKELLEYDDDELRREAEEDFYEIYCDEAEAEMESLQYDDPADIPDNYTEMVDKHMSAFYERYYRENYTKSLNKYKKEHRAEIKEAYDKLVEEYKQELDREYSEEEEAAREYINS